MSSASQLAVKLHWLSSKLVAEQKWLSAFQLLTENTRLLQENSDAAMCQKKRWRYSSTVLFYPFIQNILRCLLSTAIENNNWQLWRGFKRMIIHNPGLNELVTSPNVCSALEHVTKQNHSLCRCVHARGLPPASSWQSFQKCQKCGMLQIISSSVLAAEEKQIVQSSKLKMQRIENEKFKLTELMNRYTIELKELRVVTEEIKTSLLCKNLPQANLNNLQTDLEKLRRKYKFIAVPPQGMNNALPGVQKIAGCQKNFTSKINSTSPSAHTGSSAIYHDALFVLQALKEKSERISRGKSVLQDRLSLLSNDGRREKYKIQEVRSTSVLKKKKMNEQRIDKLSRRQESRLHHGLAKYVLTSDFGVLRIDPCIQDGYTTSKQSKNTVFDDIFEWINTKFDKESRYHCAFQYSPVFQTVLRGSHGVLHPTVFPFDFDFEHSTKEKNTEAIQVFHVFERSNIFLTKPFVRSGQLALQIAHHLKSNRWQEAIQKIESGIQRMSKTQLQGGESYISLMTTMCPSYLAPMLNDCTSFKVQSMDNLCTDLMKQIELLGAYGQSLTVQQAINALGLIRSTELSRNATLHCQKIISALSQQFSGNTANATVVDILVNSQNSTVPTSLLANEVIKTHKTNWQNAFHIYSTFYREGRGKPFFENNNHFAIATAHMLNILRRNNIWGLHQDIVTQFTPQSVNTRTARKKRSRRAVSNIVEQDPFVSHEIACAIQNQRGNLNKSKVLLTHVDSSSASFMVDPSNANESKKYDVALKRLRGNLWEKGLVLSSFTLRFLSQQRLTTSLAKDSI